MPLQREPAVFASSSPRHRLFSIFPDTAKEDFRFSDRCPADAAAEAAEREHMMPRRLCYSSFHEYMRRRQEAEDAEEGFSFAEVLLSERC
jgi:hypothetical protein